MAVNVYAWPPVGVRGWEWTEDAPISVSRSMQTGRDYVSAAQRKRRLARLEVSALARGRSGGGYMEVLKRFLEGGVGLVRLSSTPANWWLDGLPRNGADEGAALRWFLPSPPLAWTKEAEPLAWFAGVPLQGEALTSGGFPALRVTGLPANSLVGRPGDYLTLFSGVADATGTTVMMVRETRSNGAGVAVIRLLSPLSGAGRVVLGTAETAVFRPESMPRSVQGIVGDWSYSWSFREVFADEVGGFTEINPWT